MRGICAFAVLALIALSGCTGTTPAPTAAKSAAASAGSPSARPPASPSTTQPPAASPSPAPDLPVSAVDFSCRLPVLISTQNPDGSSNEAGGFITFPQASYQADPNGAIVPQPGGGYATSASPVLRSDTSGGFYDHALGRWLPVGEGQVSPDGTAYAYISVTGGSLPTQVHVVHVSDGADRAIPIAPPPNTTGWALADFDGSYVYLDEEQVDRGPVGVWRLAVATGALRQVLAPSAGTVQLVQDGVAWVSFNNPADPSPPQLPKGEGFDTLAAVNLATGVSTVWAYRPGSAVGFVSLDSAAHPIVLVLPPPFDFAVPDVLIPAPGSTGVAIPAPFYQLGLGDADTGRLWFGGSSGVYYWTLATGLLKVYSFRGDSSLIEGILPAGHCV